MDHCLRIHYDGSNSSGMIRLCFFLQHGKADVLDDWLANTLANRVCQCFSGARIPAPLIEPDQVDILCNNRHLKQP